VSGEVRGFLRGRWLLVVAAPLIAASVAAGWMLVRPTEYRGTGTLVLHVPDQRGASATLQWVTNFRSALTSRSVAAQVADEVGIPAKAVREGLSAEQIGQSAIVEVTFEGEPRRVVEPTMREATSAAVALISGADVATARAALRSAEERYEELVNERRRFLETTGALSPQDDYRARIVDLVAARRAGDDTRVEFLEQLVERLGDLAAQSQRLDDGVAQAASTLNAAERAVLVAEAPAEAAADEALEVREVTKTAKIGPAVRTGIATLVAAFVIGLALALVLEARAGRVRVPSLASLGAAAAPPARQAPAPAPQPVVGREPEPAPEPEPDHEPEPEPEQRRDHEPDAAAASSTGWPWET
jgi:hypothetical protein